MGAGAYVCGEESALIESCEGKRGHPPRLKPPYPIQVGYLGRPTCVNNVETFAAASRVTAEGAEWFRGGMGTPPTSAGTRLLSVAGGDCRRPGGVYEVEWGASPSTTCWPSSARTTLAPSRSAVRRGGSVFRCRPTRAAGSPTRTSRATAPSPSSIPPVTFSTASRTTPGSSPTNPAASACPAGRAPSISTTRCSGSSRAPRCRRTWTTRPVGGALVKKTSRCGLGGATAANPILTTLTKFPDLYRSRLCSQDGTLLPSFDVDAALAGHRNALTELETDGTT